MDIIPFLDNYAVCIEYIQAGLDSITREGIISKLSTSQRSMIDACLGQIYLRNVAEDGSVYLADEINPRKVTDYLIELGKYDMSPEILYAYVCRYAQRRINELYKNIKNENVGDLIFSMTDSKILNKRQSKKAIAIYNKKIDIRKKSGCRRLRGI